MDLSIIILAAGKGKRMRSTLPKVLHRLAGLTLLERVVNTAKQINENIYVIYGYGGEAVKTESSHLSVTWVEQRELLGTGHAVLQALPLIPDHHQVLILVGDSPLVSAATIKRLIETTTTHTHSDSIGLVTTEVDDPAGFGRILHDQTGKVLGIVEERDATTKQKKIKEINSGIITAPAKKLKEWLPALKSSNAQGEFYLTDIIEMANREDLHVQSVLVDSSSEVLGINDRIQLAKCERSFQNRQAEKVMLTGVTLLDPERFDLRGTLRAEQDVIIDINVILEGEVIIGSRSTIGPNCVLKNVHIGKDVEIKPNSVIEDAVIEDHCVIGPFARIRPQTHIQQRAKIGNFVELKKTTVGKDSKVSHLSYIGDATIGKSVNIGAGTITCNYDGINKHQTIIEDDVFIGSDSQFVAPVTVGKGAYIGSGSTITKDVPAHELTLARARQVTVKGWKKPEKKG